MADELEKLIASVIVQCHVSTPWDKEAAAIAAAIRSRWPWIDWPCVSEEITEGDGVLWQSHSLKHGECINCGFKPGPAPGEEGGQS